MTNERMTWEQLTMLPNASQWVNRPESLHLLTLLTTGEQIQLGATGWLIESGKLAVKTWVVVATSQRLICLLKSGSEFKKVELPISTMKSAYTDARLGYHEVIVESSIKKLIVSGLPKDAAVALASAISTQIDRTAKAHTLVADAPDREHAEPLPGLDELTVPPVSRDELMDAVQKVQKLEAEVQRLQQRLAAVEDIIRRAAARSASAKAAAKPVS